MINITFDKSAWPELKKIFGIKNAKCCACDKRITKRNIGGILGKNRVICNKILCLIKLAIGFSTSLN